MLCDTKSASILVVDDSEDAHLLVEEAFSASGLDPNLHFVFSGEEAIAYLSKNSAPDLILLDVAMPGMSGLATLKIIKQHETWRYIPILMFSTSNHPKDVKAALDGSANVYLQKPPDFGSLVQLVRTTGAFWLCLAQRVDCSPAC